LGNSASRLFVRRAHFGRIDEVKRILSSAPTSPRSRTLARRTSTGPTPVWIARYGPWPRRTTRSRPSGNFKSQSNQLRRSAPEPACGGRLHVQVRSEDRRWPHADVKEEQWYLSTWRIAPFGRFWQA